MDLTPKIARVRRDVPIAVLGHEISEFIVIGSGLRMLKT